MSAGDGSRARAKRLGALPLIAAALSVAGALALTTPLPRIRVTWTPIALEPGGPAGALEPGARRGGAVERVVDGLGETPGGGVAQARPDLASRGVWDGVLRVPHAGRWSIGLVSSGPATLALGELVVVRHPGAVRDARLVARSVALAAGDYPFAIRAGERARLALVWQPPEGALAVVPAEALFHGAGAVPAPRRVARAPLVVDELPLPFVHPQQIFGPVLTHWKHAVDGVPAFPPLCAVTLGGRLSGAAGATLVVAADGPLAGTVGGVAVARADARTPARIALAGAGPWEVALEHVLEDAPTGMVALVPQGARFAATRGSWLPLVLLAAGAALGWATRGAWRAVLGGASASGILADRGAAARQLAVVAVLVLGAFLRLEGRGVVPHPAETDDELIHHWNGFALTGGQAPLGWSDLPAYGERAGMFWFGRPLRVARPFLDWPPPMCLVMGLASRAAGAAHPYDVPLHATRLVPIALSVLGIWLAYRVARGCLPGSAGPVLAAAFLATCPLAIGAARLVKAEALLACAALWLFGATLRWRRSGRWSALVSIVLASAIVVATKQSGVAFALAAAALCVRGRSAGGAAACVAGALAGLATYPLWGAHWDFALYALVQQQLASQPLKVENVLSLISEGFLVDRAFGAGWMVWLWIALAGRTPARAGFVALAAALYVGIVGLTTWYPFGWYRIPLYPLLAIPAGHALARLGRQPRLADAFLLTATIVVPALALRLPLAGTTGRVVVGGVAALLCAGPALRWVARGLPAPVARASGALLVGAALVLGAAVARHLPYLDRGVSVARQPAFAALAGPDGKPDRTVRWR